MLLEPVVDFAVSITSRASDRFLQNNYNVISKMVNKSLTTVTNIHSSRTRLCVGL